MIERFDESNFKQLCNLVAERDSDLQGILKKFGYPPMWVRPNTFATLILTILEQQVSLASAYAAYNRLQQKLPLITPQTLMALTDDELKACSFSRQKVGYARNLANALISEEISLQQMEFEDDETVRSILKNLKGIGDWTVDIYLIHALRRLDLFPLGDVALVNALKDVKRLPATVSKPEMLAIAEPWRPYRSIATMILWHHYLQKRKPIANLI